MKSILLSCLLLSCFLLSAQWDRQYPFNHLGIINDININGNYGAAVGDDAAIFITNDGGSTWSIRDNDLNGWNFASVERDEDIIYACGRGIFKSEDGGESFLEIPNAPEEIFDSYLTESGVLIVSNNGGVYKSSDSGTTFSNLNTPVDSLGVCSYIYDENHIWWATAGSTPVMYITEDGGDTWTANTELTRPTTIIFYDENIGVSASLPYIYYTEDGGNTWEERGRLSRHFGKVKFGSSPDKGYITSGSNVYRTDDGFMNFTEYSYIFSLTDVNGLFRRDDGSLLVGGSYSTIGHSVDEGETWMDISPRIKPHLTAMASNNGQKVYAAGRGYILNTENGGNTWNVFDTLSTIIQDIEFVNDDEIILSGIQKILKKDLITKEETTIYGPTPGIFENFHIAPSGRWIAYSSLDYYLLSDDKGITWDSFYVEKFTNGIDMMENGDLFMRIRGKLLFSGDEGSTWKEIYKADLELDIPTMSVVDSTVYIMESSRNLRKSTDYGLTWDSISTPTGYSMIVREMHFINQDTGYIYDSTGDQLWYTYDGGLTWPYSYFPKVGLNGLYGFSNDDVESVWMYGLGGFIEKQSDCRNPPLLSAIDGVNFPCILDTVSYSVNGSNIDNYVWTVPDEWVVIGDDSGPEITIFAEEPGVGYLTVYGENACGDTDALELQIAGTAIPEVELIDQGHSLKTEADGVSFQWFKDGALISGAESNVHVPVEDGNYTVLVTFSTTCSRLSNIINVTTSSLKVWEVDHLTIYPNPVLGDYLHIRSVHIENIQDIEIMDILGRKLSIIEHNRNSDEVIIKLPRNVVSGLYFINLKRLNLSRPILIQN